MLFLCSKIPENSFGIICQILYCIEQLTTFYKKKTYLLKKTFFIWHHYNKELLYLLFAFFVVISLLIVLFTLFCWLSNIVIPVFMIYLYFVLFSLIFFIYFFCNTNFSHRHQFLTFKYFWGDIHFLFWFSIFFFRCFYFIFELF